MRSAILDSLSFSVRNDGSYQTLLELFPQDDAVRKKVWEVPDPGMLLPASICNMVRSRKMRLVSALGFQPAWNGKPSINRGRGGPHVLQAAAQLI